MLWSTANPEMIRLLVRSDTWRYKEQHKINSTYTSGSFLRSPARPVSLCLELDISMKHIAHPQATRTFSTQVYIFGILDFTTHLTRHHTCVLYVYKYKRQLAHKHATNSMFLPRSCPSTNFRPVASSLSVGKLETNLGTRPLVKTNSKICGFFSSLNWSG